MTPQRSPDDSEHIPKGGGLLAIPSGLSDRNLPIRVQRLSKERHEAEDGQRAKESNEE